MKHFKKYISLLLICLVSLTGCGKVPQVEVRHFDQAMEGYFEGDVERWGHIQLLREKDHVTDSRLVMGEGLEILFLQYDSETYADRIADIQVTAEKNSSDYKEYHSQSRVEKTHFERFSMHVTTTNSEETQLYVQLVRYYDAVVLVMANEKAAFEKGKDAVSEMEKLADM
ncbi:MAG: hypothetical protein SPL15_06370 [Lachnospiraceae bacterium]|nr:hypothetical protein [Lachnospiraceae bacterium]MDY5742600.1 hypothetical protein [Lachnospiraceae bacterium]